MRRRLTLFNPFKSSPNTAKRPRWKRLVRLIARAMIWYFVITFSWVLIYRWVNPPVTYLQIRERIGCPDGQSNQKTWVELDEISIHMKMAVVASEDNNFMKHNGFDWGAIDKARKHNESHTRKRGASTISQQVAKNTFLWPSRSWIRKGFEVYFTVLIELMWSKERILEVYLNVIETGPCTFGVEAAARKYFKKPASSLSAGEAALIAGALPNPKKMNPGNPGNYLAKRRDHITRLMRLIGYDYFERHQKK